MIYRKHYTGNVTGSFAGRDDGYPEPRIRQYTNIEDLARDHGTEADESYEIIRIEPIPDDFEEQIAAAQVRNAAADHEAEQQVKRDKIAQLQQELKDDESN